MRAWWRSVALRSLIPSSRSGVETSPTLAAVVIAVYASSASVFGGTTRRANLPSCLPNTVMTFGESWLASSITLSRWCWMLGAVGDQSCWWKRTRSIGPNRSQSASSSEGSSTVSRVDRGHQPPCTKPQDRCAGFNRNRKVPIVGRRVCAAPTCLVVVDMCWLLPSWRLTRCFSCKVSSSPLRVNPADKLHCRVDSDGRLAVTRQCEPEPL